MIELSINNLIKYYGANKLFEHISLEVKTGERVGLIGQNGCGKTTIMKIIMGLEEFQGGEINLRKGVKIGYLNQIPNYPANIKAMDVISSACDNTFAIKNQMDKLEKSFERLSEDSLDKAVKKYGELMEQFELQGGYELETKINKIIEGLEITSQMKEMFFNQLSGGERTRVILAKILLEEPDILLLDEPTNHLDLATTEWLENFLKDYPGSVLAVSHDRYFLDSVVCKIIELESNRSDIYLGNYSYYVIEKERRFLIEYRNYQNQQKKIDQMERQIQRYRIWGEMRDSDKMFRRAKELEKRLEKIEVLDRPVLSNKRIRLGQDSANRSGKIVLETKSISKSYENTVLLHDVNLTLFYQDSACIIGRNGSGKSTLLKIMLGEISPDEGIVKCGAQVKIGYLPQHVIYEDEEQTILEYFAQLHNITYEAARSQLAKVLFLKEDVNKRIRVLSGGEKSRLRLCSLTFDAVNCLILDEPTNHLDIESREVLEETLSNYDGTILFVSHDRYFINKIANKVITLENKGIYIYPGDYSYYLEEYQKAHKEEIEISSVKKDTIKETKEKSDSNKESYYNNKKISNKTKSSINSSNRKVELLEQNITVLEGKIRTFEEIMNEYNSDTERLNEIFTEKEKTQKELDDAYMEWEQLQLEQ